MMYRIDDLLDILKYGRKGRVREVIPGESPDFVKKQDKLCTGMMGINELGISYSFDLDPPVMLHAGRGYVIELDAI